LRSNEPADGTPCTGEGRVTALAILACGTGASRAGAAKRSTGTSPIASSTPIASYQASRACAEIGSEPAICLARRDFLCVVAQYDSAAQYRRLVPPAKAGTWPERSDGA